LLSAQSGHGRIIPSLGRLEWNQLE
jgi:hypothetical protein